jgi:hypothetical protein
MTSPTGRYPQLAAWRSSRVAVSSWKPANPAAQPVSAASRAMISSRRRSTMSAARRNIACLSAEGRSAHAGKAAAAASTARAASALVPAGTRATTVPRLLPETRREVYLKEWKAELVWMPRNARTAFCASLLAGSPRLAIFVRLARPRG